MNTHKIHRVISTLAIPWLVNSAQADPAQPQPQVKVPFSFCSVCIPTDIDECCEASVTACTRVDNLVVTDPGTPVTLLSTKLNCDTCRPDCPCCPEHSGGSDCADCDNIDPEVCVVNLTLTWSTNVSYSISALIGAELGAPGVAQVKSELRQSLGLSNQAIISVDLTCGWPSLSACQHKSTTPFISGAIGAAAEITHTWSASGVWATAADCEPGDCPIAGGPWNVSACRVGTSTVTGDPHFTADCGTTTDFGCP